MKTKDTTISVRYMQFRRGVTKYSFKLLWAWAGLMLFGLGTLHFKSWQGESVGYTRDDLQPDPEVSQKVGRLIRELGLDKTTDNPRR
ncbi:hypothetical protein EMCRGX_G032057 [Ephydatia muelleri]